MDNQEAPPYLLACELWELTLYVKRPKRGSRVLLSELDRIGWRLMHSLGDAPHAESTLIERRQYQSAERLVKKAEPVVDKLRALLAVDQMCRIDELMAAIKRVVARELARLAAN